MQRMKEEKVIVLDMLKHGYAEDSRSMFRREQIVQAVGVDYFVLFELVPRPDIEVNQFEELYIGEGERPKVKYIKGTLNFNQLTNTSKAELPHLLEKLVIAKEQRFVQFLNNAPPISLRAHSLELLPGVGKKHTAQILEERRIKPFDSFEDFKKRVSAVSNPVKVIIARIIEELEEKDRHRLFVGV